MYLDELAHTVDGSEIGTSCLYIPGGCLGFPNHHQYYPDNPKTKCRNGATIQLTHEKHTQQRHLPKTCCMISSQPCFFLQKESASLKYLDLPSLSFCLPFQKKLPKSRNFTYLSDPGILNLVDKRPSPTPTPVIKNLI